MAFIAPWKSQQMARSGKGAAEEIGMRALVGGVSGVAVGYVEGRYPDRAKFGGLPLSLVVAGVALGVKATGHAGKHSDEVESAGLGARAAWAYQMGKERGAEAAKK